VNGLGPGNYTFIAIARDSAGASASASSSITVNGNQPTISTGPQTQTVNAGSDVTLTVQATGTPPLSYAWLFQSNLINGATGPSLVLTNVSPADKGLYEVQVSNAFGSASAFATLNVTSPPSGTPPTFTLEPHSQTVNAGSNVTFTAEAIGSTPLSWQWFFNGAPIADATNRSLNLPDVGPANEGFYFMSVNNAFGSATSSNATLTVVTCDFTLSKQSSTFAPEGGPDSVDVISPTSCAWAIQNTNTWVQITSGTNGAGPATVRFTVASNATAPALGTAWQAVGLGDFNRDLQADILFRHAEGYLMLWYMKGKQYVRQTLLYKGQAVPTLWRVAGVADIDNDGYADILWQK